MTAPPVGTWAMKHIAHKSLSLICLVSRRLRILATSTPPYIFQDKLMAALSIVWYFIPPSLLVFKSSRCILAKPRLPDGLRAGIVDATPNCDGQSNFHQPIKSR